MKNISKNSGGFAVLEIVIIIAILIVASLTGYFVAKHTEKKVAPSPVALVVSSVGGSNSTKDITSQQTANSILADIKDLQLQPSGTVNCPADEGPIYTLKFTSPAVTATADATGCEEVTLSSTKTVYTADTTNRSGPAFWSAVSRATGMTVGPSN